MNSMDFWINKLKLVPHPEGGYFRETYRCEELFSVSSGQVRAASTAIYYLLGPGDCSTWHRIKSDEIWHFYDGVPIQIFYFSGNELVCKSLGHEHGFQTVVPANHWFAAKPKIDGFSLVGCTVSPGFDFADFEMAVCETMKNLYPKHADFISSFYPT